MKWLALKAHKGSEIYKSKISDAKRLLKYSKPTCKTRFGSPVFCDNCLRSLASGLWFIAKYDFIVRNWWCLNDVLIRFVRDDALPMLPRPKPKSIYSEFRSGNKKETWWVTRCILQRDPRSLITCFQLLSYDLFSLDHYLIKHLLSLRSESCHEVARFMKCSCVRWHESDTVSSFKDHREWGRMQVDSIPYQNTGRSYLNPFILATVSQHFISCPLIPSRARKKFPVSFQAFLHQPSSWAIKPRDETKVFGSSTLKWQWKLFSSYSRRWEKAKFEIIMMELLVKWICGYRVV